MGLPEENIDKKDNRRLIKGKIGEDEVRSSMKVKKRGKGVVWTIYVEAKRYNR